MNNPARQTGNLFISAFLSLLKSSGKIVLISIAWAMRFSGMFILKFGEIIEKAILKVNR